MFCVVDFSRGLIFAFVSDKHVLFDFSRGLILVLLSETRVCFYFPRGLIFVSLNDKRVLFSFPALMYQIRRQPNKPKCRREGNNYLIK